MKNPTAGLLSFSLLLACTQQNSRNDLSHDVDQPVRNSQPWQWFEVSDEQLATALGPMMGMSYLPHDDILVKRLQFWVDAIDQTIRDKYPNELANTPRPKVEVIPAEIPNAFVAMVPLCASIPFLFEDRDAIPDRTALMSRATIFGGEIIPAPFLGDCLAEVTDEQLTSFVQQVNADNANCKLKLKMIGDQKVLVAGPQCVRRADTAVTAGAKKLLLFSASNRLTVMSGLLDIFTDETAITGVLAHELGHYYRHAYSPEGAYGYFYELVADGPDHKPVADPDLLALGIKAVNSSIGYEIYSRYKRVPGQKYRSEIFHTAGYMVNNLCYNEERPCSDQCMDLKNFLDSSTVSDQLKAFPEMALGDAGREIYFQYEAKLELCGKSLFVVDEVFLADHVSVADVEQNIHPMLLERLGHIQSGRSLDDTLKSLGAKMYQDEYEIKSTLTEAATKHLGYYTQEQEADELAAEWMYDMGIDPTTAISFFLKMENMMDKLGYSRHPLSYNGEECEAFYQNDWKSLDGSPMIMPIGTYLDIHHSPCFRAYNLAREIQEHSFYLAGDKTPPLPPADQPSWEAIQERARSLSNRNLGLNLDTDSMSLPLSPNLNNWPTPVISSGEKR